MVVIRGATATHVGTVIRVGIVIRGNSVIHGRGVIHVRAIRYNRGIDNLASEEEAFSFSRGKKKRLFAQNTTRQDFIWLLLKKVHIT